MSRRKSPVPLLPSSTGQRSTGRVCCYLQCHIWAREGEIHGLSNPSSLMNHSNPEFWGQKTHHRLINEPVFVIFHKLGVHWTLESNMWDSTWVPQTALFQILPQQSSEQSCVLSTATGQLNSWRQSSPVASCISHLLHPDQLNKPTLDYPGPPLFLLSSCCDSHEGKCKP